MTSKDHAQPYKHSTDWRDWERSGENALRAARKLLECEHYNYACYVGQEALELYVKALLVQHDPQIDVENEVGHNAWLYFFDATKEHASSMSEYNPGLWNTIDSPLTKLRNDLNSKMENSESQDKMWLAHRLAPSAIKGNDVPFYKSPGRIKKEIRRANDDAMEQCDPQQVRHMERLTKSRFLEDFPSKAAFKDLMSHKNKQDADNTPFRRLVPLLALEKHLNALLLAKVHQQCTRYPTIVDGQAVKFSKDEISEYGIADVDYKSKWYVTTTSYTHAMAQSMLDEFEAAIAGIKYCLDHTAKILESP